MDWQKTLIPMNASLSEALSVLQSSALQILLVVSDEKKLEGTLTDGDIRRGLLKGYALGDSINELMTKNPMVVGEDVSLEGIKALMRTNGIYHLPVIDKFGSVTGLHTLSSLMGVQVRKNPVFIMAGGKGERLRPYTQKTPKPMLIVRDKPILQHIIERVTSFGFVNFIISINYLGSIIRDYFQDGLSLGVNISYLAESEPLGTAGALSLIRDKPTLPFIVINGDILTDMRFDEFLNFHETHGASATMAVRPHEIQNPYGVVLTQGLELEKFVEKPVYKSYINAGMYVLDPCVLKYLRYGEHVDMPSLFMETRRQVGKTIVYPIHENWLDIGTPGDFFSAQQEVDS